MSRTFRINTLAAVRTEGVVESYWIEALLFDDHWRVIEHCEDWNDAVTKMERWHDTVRQDS